MNYASDKFWRVQRARIFNTGGDRMTCSVCRREVFLQGGGGGWLHRQPPTIHHNIGTPVTGTEPEEVTALNLGTGLVIGSLDEAPMGEGHLPGTRHNLILRIAEIGLQFAEEQDPKNHCQCAECQERCERCKELTHG